MYRGEAVYIYVAQGLGLCLCHSNTKSVRSHNNALGQYRDIDKNNKANIIYWLFIKCK